MIEVRTTNVLKKFTATLAIAVCLSLSSWAAASNDPQFDRAVALFNQKQYQQALPIFRNLVNAPSAKPTPFYYAGLCYQYTGDAATAQRCYQMLLERYPTSPEAKLAQQAMDSMKAQAAAAAAKPRAQSNVNMSMVTDAPLSVASLRQSQMTDEEWKRTPDEIKIPFKRHTSSHLFVNGSVNGHPLPMMFDTGAEQCVFSRSQLAALGITPDADSPRLAMGGVAGTSGCTMMRADITVGDLRRRIPILVADQDMGMPLVGETFFKDFRYDIDNSSGFIRFRKKDRPGLTSHSFESTDVISIPYENMGNNMVVSVKVNGREIPMIFDTGSFAICLSAVHAAQLGISVPSDARMMATGGVGGRVMAYEFPVDRIELGPIIKSHINVVVNAAATPPLPLLGQPFYKDRHFTVDTENHLIKFAH